MDRVKVYRVQLPDKNPYYELQEAEAQSRAQKFKDKQCKLILISSLSHEEETLALYGLLVKVVTEKVCFMPSKMPACALPAK